MSSLETPYGRLSWLDRMGIVISSICLVHCLALPLLIALLPVVASALPADGWVHPLLIGLALPVTGLALWRGYRRHRRIVPTSLGIAGLGLIALALAAEGWGEALLTVGGGVLVSLAHILNWRSHSPHHHRNSPPAFGTTEENATS